MVAWIGRDSPINCARVWLPVRTLARDHRRCLPMYSDVVRIKMDFSLSRMLIDRLRRSSSAMSTCDRPGLASIQEAPGLPGHDPR